MTQTVVLTWSLVAARAAGIPASLADPGDLVVARVTPGGDINTVLFAGTTWYLTPAELLAFRPRPVTLTPEETP